MDDDCDDYDDWLDDYWQGGAWSSPSWHEANNKNLVNQQDSDETQTKDFFVKCHVLVKCLVSVLC
jgi:hypothetical protein